VRSPTGTLPTMVQVFVKTLACGTAVVRDAATVGELRATAAAASGVATGELRLIGGAHELGEDALTLLDAGLVDGSTVYSTLRVLGGGKKRKKKTYTKPKKIKHKKKKVPMAVLKYYKVSDDGKVERLRRECPHETCGAGIFMAAHKDRHYCGKCGLTYALDKETA